MPTSIVQQTSAGTSRMPYSLSGLILVMMAPLCLAGSPPAQEAIPDISGKVITVNGPVRPSELGMTLMHEHIFIDYSLPLDQPEKWRTIGVHYPDTPELLQLWQQPLTIDILSRLQIAWPANHDALVLDDEALAVSELLRYKDAGGGTVVELSNTGMGRNPGALRRVARKTGLNIVMGSGWYRDEWLDDDVLTRSVDDMAAEIVRDIVEGVGESGIRSGIIGEVGVESHPPADPLTEREIKSLSAAGRAAMMTGAPLSLHTLLVPPQSLEVLDRLEQEGMDLRRVIVGHLHAVIARDLDYLLDIARRGVYLQFDLMGFRESTVVEEFIDDRALVDAIAALFDRGFGDRILLSQDTAIKLQLTRYGGYGYAFIANHMLPYLERRGFTREQLHSLVIDNPARALTFAAPANP